MIIKCQKYKDQNFYTSSDCKGSIIDVMVRDLFENSLKELGSDPQNLF